MKKTRVVGNIMHIKPYIFCILITLKYFFRFIIIKIKTPGKKAHRTRFETTKWEIFALDVCDLLHSLKIYFSTFQTLSLFILHRDLLETMKLWLKFLFWLIAFVELESSFLGINYNDCKKGHWEILRNWNVLYKRVNDSFSWTSK